MNLVLDVRGLLTYPGFKERFLEPVEQAGFNIRFWTHEHPIVAEQMLSEIGLSRYLPTTLYDSTSEEAQSIDVIQRMINDEGYYLYKYSPILGEENYLLVESDNAMRFPEDAYELTQSLHTQSYLDLARRAGFSVILVPEHPLVWEGFQRAVSPEQVMEELAREVLNWKGEQKSVDLGQRLGIYNPQSRK